MSKLCFFLFFLLPYSSLSAASDQEQLLFVFEMIRHGARTGQEPWVLENTEGEDVFPVGMGMLTFSGMRHRYLYGRMTREKYMKGEENMKILDEDYVESQLMVHSTNYYRAMQSAQAELLGMYPPSEQNVLSQGEMKSLESGKGMPPLRIRAANGVNDLLGSKSIVDGFTQIPVYLYTEQNVKDDINFKACEYLRTANIFYYNDNKTFEYFYENYIPPIKDGIIEGFGLDPASCDSFTYGNYQDYTDEIINEQYEGAPTRYPFSPEQELDIKFVNKAELTQTFPGDTYVLWGSRMMRVPLEKLQERLEKVYAGKDNNKDLKYVLYSAHDIQLGNLIKFLNFTDFDYLEVSFCSQFILEAYQNLECSEKSEDPLNECTRVHMTFNGLPLKFGYCVERNLERGSESEDCNYYDFLAYYDSIVLKEDLDEYCYKTFTPPY